MSKLNKSFTYNYRNNNLIYVDDIVKIFQAIAKKNKIEFSYNFKNTKKKLSRYKNKAPLAKNIFSHESSKNILKNYYNKILNKNAKLL